MLLWRGTWPLSQISASAKQVLPLVVFLMHVSFAFRPGSLFVHDVLTSDGMPRIAAGAEYACRMIYLSPSGTRITGISLLRLT